MEMKVGVKQVTEGGLLLETDILQEAHLGQNVQVIIREGEIHLLPAEEEDWKGTLDELAGCLGEEPVRDYDFDLKLRNLYEA